MKKTKFNLLLFTAAIALSACNKDDVALTTDGDTTFLPKEMVTINFSTKAPAFSNGLLTRAGEKFPTNLFRVLAFRHNGTDYMYLDDVNFQSISYDETNRQFNGTAQLPVGVYKFIPSYGLPKTSDANVTLTDLSGKPALSNSLTATHIGTLPAIYLREDANISSDTLGTHTGTQNVVTATIKRAISRVDVLFVRATKETDGTYQEIEGDDVFGTHSVASIVLDLKGVTPSVRLMDGGVVAGPTMPTSFTVVNQVISDGSNTTGSTIGESTGEIPYDFDNVGVKDIMKGGHYAYGPYVFPFSSTTTTTNLTLTVTSGKETGNHVYERSIDIENVPLSRNKVTMIKLYVLRGDFFNTEVAFEIGVKEAWEGSHIVDGEAS